ncbi:MAG TPA: hypothetical protein VJ947_08785, partial [Pseudohaliea sp.]|nr:hypothetical protein [Pseudohaliea sp.]
MTQTIDPGSPAAEQARTVHQKHITPALKQAIKDAQGSGFSDGAILNGMAAAYGDFLVMTLGRDKAAELLAAQAEHLRVTPTAGNGGAA